MGRRLGWVIALASCADPGIPPEQDLVRTFVAEGRRVVEGPTFRMVFSATGVKMPEQFFVNEVDRLAPAACGEPSLIGVGVEPAINAVAGLNGNADPESEVRMVLEGPVIAKAEVDYSVFYDCDSAQTLAGTTTFTFFPGGRIVRQDNVTPSTTPLATTNNPCGCNQGMTSAYSFASFWAFDPNGAMQITSAGVAPTDGVDQGACTIFPGGGIAMNWQDAGSARYRNATHAYEIRGGGSLSNAPSGPVFSALQVDGDTVLSPNECGPLLGLLAVTPLVVNGADRSTGDDGIFFEQNVVHTGRITLEAKNVPVPAGFAVKLDLGGARHATVSREPFRYAIQRGAGNEYFFWFQDELAIGDSIIIEPE
jgi:hypothetical protein